MCITKNGSENREPFLADHLKKRRIWGMSYFQDASPESLGISSGGILRFLDRMEEKNIELHSFMVVRHGKCAAKGWWKPYAPELAHPLYSFGKTLTATAIGFARQEKILSLEERLVDLFPELLPKEPSENLQKVTLWHLLTMSCGHETEIDMESPDWIREFLQHPFLHEPGTFYKYNTAGTNMLAAGVEEKNRLRCDGIFKAPSAGAPGHYFLDLFEVPGTGSSGNGWRRYADDDGGHGAFYLFCVKPWTLGRQAAAGRGMV